MLLIQIDLYSVIIKYNNKDEKYAFRANFVYGLLNHILIKYLIDINQLFCRIYHYISFIDYMLK